MSLRAQIGKTFQAACITPPSVANSPSLFQHEQMLLRQLGKQLVEQAGKHIPMHLLNSADQWSGLQTAQQVRLLHRFYRWIAKEQVRLPATQTLEQLMEASAVPYDARALFPNCWGREGVTPNCLGLLMIIAHFAQRTGSPFRVVNIITMGGSVLAHTLGKLYALAKPDLEQRYLVLDNELLEQMHKKIIRGQFPGLGISSFHHALVIQLKDGRWYCLDPNTNSKGFTPATWQLDLPVSNGPESVQLTGSDKDSTAFENRHLSTLELAICHSRRLEAQLSDLMDDWIVSDQREGASYADPLAKLLRLLKCDEGWHFLQTLHPANQRRAKLMEKLKEAKCDPEIRLLLCLLPGVQSPSREELMAAAKLFRSDMVHRAEGIRHLLSRFHFWSVSRYFSQLEQQKPRLLHPWVEVNAHPYQAIGLFATNSLRHAHGWRASARYLQHSSSQLVAREILNNGSLASEVRQQIVTILRGTTVLHPLVQHTLDREVLHGSK